MRRIFFLQMLFAWIVLAGVAAESGKEAAFNADKWRGTPSDWQVKAELERKAFQVAMAIPLRLTMRNVTTSAKRLVSTYPFAGFWIQIRNAEGAVVPNTERVAKLRGPTQAASVHSPRVEPGSVFESTINLGEYFQLTKPGTYTVHVRRHYSLGAMDSDGKVVPKESPGDPKPVVFTLTP